MMANIPHLDWTHSTFVFCHADEQAARDLNKEFCERFPFFDEGIPNRLSAVAVGDAMSVSDAMRMALECRKLDSYEQRELALELAECVNWDGCLAKAAEWDLQVKNGEFVNAAILQGPSA